MNKMTLTERISILRQAAIQGRKDPGDLFGARMAIHKALSGMGYSTTEICKTLLTRAPPLDEYDCARIETLASLIEKSSPESIPNVLGLSEVISMIMPWGLSQ